MNEVLSAGIDSILWMQSFRSSGLDGAFEVVTNLGGSYYLYMIPMLLWCVDYRTGVRVVPIFALTLFFNTTIKEWIAQPRPFQMDGRVWSDGEMGYGLPSGHAQLVVVFWGTIAAWVAKPWFWALSIAIMFAIGVSRMYLGVHFPSDVIAGWALGALTLWVALIHADRFDGWVRDFSLGGPIGLALVGAAFVYFFDLFFVHDHDHLNQGVAGFLAGGGVGAALAHRHLHFDGRGPIWMRVLRYVLGMALFLVLLGTLRRLGVPDGPLGGLVIVLDLAAMGLYLTFIAPWLFERVRLAPRSG